MDNGKIEKVLKLAKLLKEKRRIQKKNNIPIPKEDLQVAKLVQLAQQTIKATDKFKAMLNKKHIVTIEGESVTEEIHTEMAAEVGGGKCSIGPKLGKNNPNRLKKETTGPKVRLSKPNSVLGDSEEVLTNGQCLWKKASENLSVIVLIGDLKDGIIEFNDKLRSKALSKLPCSQETIEALETKCRFYWDIEKDFIEKAFLDLEEETINNEVKDSKGVYAFFQKQTKDCLDSYGKAVLSLLREIESHEARIKNPKTKKSTLIKENNTSNKDPYDRRIVGHFVQKYETPTGENKTLTELIRGADKGRLASTMRFLGGVAELGLAYNNYNMPSFATWSNGITDIATKFKALTKTLPDTGEDFGKIITGD